MKKALAHDGLARGLHESARAIERGQAQVRARPPAPPRPTPLAVPLLPPCTRAAPLGPGGRAPRYPRSPWLPFCSPIFLWLLQLAILAEDCNQPDYKKLIEALCAEQVRRARCVGRGAADQGPLACSAARLGSAAGRRGGRALGLAAAAVPRAGPALSCKHVPSKCPAPPRTALPQSVNLIAVPEQQTLGQWAGLCKIDSEGEARKVRSWEPPAPLLPALLPAHLALARPPCPCCAAPLPPLTRAPLTRALPLVPPPHTPLSPPSSSAPHQVVKCSCAVITDNGEETEGLAILQEYLKSR